MSKPANMLNADLRRAVDWKLFELTSSLISDEVQPEDFETSKLWFQERHAQDVVEERFTCGLCAYPLCYNPLKTYTKATHFKDRSSTETTSPGKKSLVTSAETKYRIDYSNKEIYQVERSKYYCSDQCLTTGELWISRLDGISPYARTNLTKNLLKKDPSFIEKQLHHEKIPIEEVLALLGPSASPNKVSANTTSTNPAPLPPVPTSETAVDSRGPPPPYEHAHLTPEGAVCVEVVHGTPVLQPAIIPDTTTKPQNKAATNEEGGREVNMENISHQDISRLISATASRLQQAASQSQSQSQSPSQATAQPRIRKVRPTALRGANLNSAVPSSTNPLEGSQKESLLADMAALQAKYGLSPDTAHVSIPTTSTTTATTTINTNAAVQTNNTSSGSGSSSSSSSSSIGNSERTESDVPAALPTPPSATDAVVTPAAGRGGKAAQAVSARGPKTVSWDAPSSVPIAKKPAPVPAAATKATTTKKGPLVALKIVERDNAQPLSAAALPTKREPGSTSTSSAGSSNVAAMEEEAKERWRQAMTIEGHQLNSGSK